MSVISVGGRRYAAGLYWLERGSARATARTARRLGRPWCVHHGDARAGGRTGFAADDPPETLVPETLVPETLAPETLVPETRVPETPGHADRGPEGGGPSGSGPEGLGPSGLGPSGLPALALALEAHIEGSFWMALVEGDTSGDGGAEGGGRYALVKARGGAVLADGDEVFEDREAAVTAFERARGLGWTLFATPGPMAELGGAEIAVLDPAALGEAADAAGAAIVLEPAAPARTRRGLLAAALGAAALVAGAAWFGVAAVVDWLAAPLPAPMAPGPEPTVAVAVDGAALIAACRQGLIESPPFLPAWRIERIACAARFSDPALIALRPELAGRPVLVVRWRLAAGHSEALQRRLAEAHLARWHAAQVSDGRAWAMAPLAPVLRVADPETPSFLELRRAVDRAFGTGGGRIGYARNADGAWSVRIDDPGPLARLGPLAGGIAGLEITEVARGGDTRAGDTRAVAGPWRLEGRPAAPETVALARLAALGIAHEAAPAGAATGQPETLVSKTLAPETLGSKTLVPEKETDDGTDRQDAR